MTRCDGTLEAERKGQVTLRRYDVKAKPATALKPDEVRKVRERLNPSRAVFARTLRTNERTLQN